MSSARTSWCAGMRSCASSLTVAPSGARARERHHLVARARRAPVDQVHDLAAPGARRWRRAARRRTPRARRRRAARVPDPVVAAGLPARAVHALLHDHPGAVVGDDEAVQVQLEAVLHGGAVDLGDQAAGAHQRGRVQPQPLAERGQLVGRAARVAPAAAADVQAQLVLDGPEAALERADHAGGDPRRVPVHPHHRAERLEPERVATAGAAPRCGRTRARSPRRSRGRGAPSARQPRGHAPAVQRQVGGSRLLRHRAQRWRCAPQC